MNILVVDDEKGAFNVMMDAVRKAAPGSEIAGFRMPYEALDYAKTHTIDVAFLDMEMPEMNGITLARQLKKKNPQVNLIFATAYRQYGVDAMQIHASGYLLKPVMADDVKVELDYLRYPVNMTIQGIRAVTFGNFELLKDGEPIIFGRNKSKEMLAYLIDNHGNGMTKKELASVLFEDREYDRTCQDYMNKIIYDLKNTLKEEGIEQIFIRKYNYYAVDTELFSCDLYEYEKGNPMAINAFHGEYMKQYSWGEYTLGQLYE